MLTYRSFRCRSVKVTELGLLLQLGTYIKYVKEKVKVTLVQSLRLCAGRTAHRGSRGIALPFLDHGTRRGVRGQRHAPSALYSRYPLYRTLDGPQGRPGQVRKISPPTGIRFPDCPARSPSLYRLRYPAYTLNMYSYVILVQDLIRSDRL